MRSPPVIPPPTVPRLRRVEPQKTFFRRPPKLTGLAAALNKPAAELRPSAADKAPAPTAFESPLPDSSLASPPDADPDLVAAPPGAEPELLVESPPGLNNPSRRPMSRAAPLEASRSMAPSCSGLISVIWRKSSSEMPDPEPGACFSSASGSYTVLATVYFHTIITTSIIT